MTERKPSMADWLEGELYRRRIVQIAGPLDDEAGARLAATLMAMDAEGDDAVELRVTSSGGSMEAAYSLIDTIELLGVPVRATALGAVFGPAAFVLALCPTRRAAPSARIRLAAPTFSHEGRPEDLVRATEADRLRIDELTERLAAACGRPVEEVARDIRVGRTFTAGEALEAGLVDEITLGSRHAAADHLGAIGDQTPKP